MKASLPPAARAACAPRIRLLPSAVRSRIAAGEVIERPASVLKELVENALDAGARSVDVLLAGGGRELIRVADDGEGMRPADLALSVRRHATSKLRCAEDLQTIRSLGFRGEALPSIGSVSRMRIRTRHAQAEHAWSLDMEGGAAGEPAPASGPGGTVVEVRDLFYNLPARRKFLKGPGPEAAACSELLLRLALARPEVAFSLKQGRQTILEAPAFRGAAEAGDDAGEPAGPARRSSTRRLPLEAYLQRARAVLGRRLARELLPVAVGPLSPSLAPARDSESTARDETSPEAWKLFGLLSPPALTRPNRSQIYFAVNGRPLKDRTLLAAVTQAYRHLLPPKRFPSAVLFLELPGEEVDINVHPTKAEVRFRRPSAVFSLLHRAVRQAFAPRVNMDAPGEVLAPNGHAKPFAPSGPSAPFAPQQTFDLWQGERTAPAPVPASTPTPTSSLPASRAAEAPAPYAGKKSSGKNREEAFRPDTAPAAAGKVFTPSSPAQSPPPGSGAAFRVLGQAGGRYIVLEDDEGVKLIDQHALHERVLFEDLLARARKASPPGAQKLLLPETLELSPAQAAAFGDPEARSVLQALGFELSEFGPRTLAVRAVPNILRAAPAAGLVRELLDELAQLEHEHAAGSQGIERTRFAEKAAYRLSCRGAVKAGERLTLEQMSALVEAYRRRVGPSGFTCPHGRPVAVELSWAQIERKVGRR